MPVKRMMYERNEMLTPWGWNLRLWGLGDVTPENFPRTYAAIRRGLDHHARTGDNVFSMLGDLMKFEILYQHGGLYLDTNVELSATPRRCSGTPPRRARGVFRRRPRG